MSTQSGELDLIAFGTVFLEFVFGEVPGLPTPGEEVFSGQFAVSCGGGAVSAATAARRAGARAGLATTLGDDFGSRVVAAHCAAAGVELSPSRRIPGDAAGVSVVLNFAGDRAFVSHLPEQVRPMGDPGWWPEAVADYRPKWIYLYANRRALPAIQAARRLGCRVAVDTELGTIASDPEVVLQSAAEADIFLLNSGELAALAGGPPDAGTALARRLAATVIVKEGDRGAVVITGNRTQRISAGVREVEVRDRTGAGDAFAGALLGSLARGLDPAAAVAAANAAGSEAVARLGAVGPVVLP